jgi:Sec-independent protein translocase protein TatA
MRDWIVILILYVLVFGLFRLLEGFASAGEAFRSWGSRSTTIRPRPGSSS